MICRIEQSLEFWRWVERDIGQEDLGRMCEGWHEITSFAAGMGNIQEYMGGLYMGIYIEYMGGYDDMVFCVFES